MTDNDTGQAFLLTLLFFNFLPAIVASVCRHKNALATGVAIVSIDFLSIFLISIPPCAILWFGCLIWSLTR
jgi:hypothetical protein